MIQDRSFLRLADNSGAKLVQCIKVYKTSKVEVGSIVLVSVKQIRSQSKLAIFNLILHFFALSPGWGRWATPHRGEGVAGGCMCNRNPRNGSRSVEAVSFSPDGRHLASGSDDRSVKLWSAETGECLNTLDGHS